MSELNKSVKLAAPTFSIGSAFFDVANSGCKINSTVFEKGIDQKRHDWGYAVVLNFSRSLWSLCNRPFSA